MTQQRRAKKAHPSFSLSESSSSPTFSPSQLMTPGHLACQKYQARDTASHAEGSRKSAEINIIIITLFFSPEDNRLATLPRHADQENAPRRQRERQKADFPRRGRRMTPLKAREDFGVESLAANASGKALFNIFFPLFRILRTTRSRL